MAGAWTTGKRVIGRFSVSATKSSEGRDAAVGVTSGVHEMERLSCSSRSSSRAKTKERGQEYATSIDDFAPVAAWRAARHLVAVQNPCARAHTPWPALVPVPSPLYGLSRLHWLSTLAAPTSCPHSHCRLAWIDFVHCIAGTQFQLPFQLQSQLPSHTLVATLFPPTPASVSGSGTDGTQTLSPQRNFHRGFFQRFRLQVMLPPLSILLKTDTCCLHALPYIIVFVWPACLLLLPLFIIYLLLLWYTLSVDPV